MSFIPDSEWLAYTAKVGANVLVCDMKRRRHWEKLHDVFNEAAGARLLTTRYSCDSIRLIPTGKRPSPDWFGSACWRRHYLEVKTINHSDDERVSWYGGCDLTHTCSLPLSLVEKLRSTYRRAVDQLNSVPDAENARKLVLLVVNVDYNVDPFDCKVEDLILRELNVIERPDAFIHCEVRVA